MRLNNLFCLLIVIIPFISCSARIDGSVFQDGSAVFSPDLSLGQRMTAMIRSMNSAGGQPDSLVLDGQAIARSMSMDGITSVSFRNTAPAAVKGEIHVSDINRFLNEGDKGGFINFQRRPAGGSCGISINLESGKIILDSFSPEIADYLGALMAPIATGEKLSKNEYLELVSMFYNRAISGEISSSRIVAVIEFPGAISSVAGGTFSGRRAEFDIPLLDLLVLDTPLYYEVIWK